MLNLILVGILCFVVGLAVGTLGDPYEDDERVDESREDYDCKDCFGAAFGDCDHCPKNQD